MREYVHGVGLGSGRMGFVARTKAELKAFMAVGPEGGSLMVSWSWRPWAH
jgi:hypothetical protein